MAFTNKTREKEYKHSWYMQQRKSQILREKEKRRSLSPENKIRYLDYYRKYRDDNRLCIRAAAKKCYHKRSQDPEVKLRKYLYTSTHRDLINLTRHKNHLRNPLLARKYGQNRRARNYNAGELALEIIQKVYENNIHQFGFLKCYLCDKPIVFGRDTIEHKIPLVRGGLNIIENLAVAHRSCNCKKHTKTDSEYRESLKCLV